VLVQKDAEAVATASRERRTVPNLPLGGLLNEYEAA
jgi:hypothetical protein